MGKPARALAAEYADQLAFAAEHTGLTPHYLQMPGKTGVA
jgi:prolyl oligopeptidase